MNAKRPEPAAIRMTNFHEQAAHAMKWHEEMVRELKTGGFVWQPERRAWVHPDGTEVMEG